MTLLRNGLPFTAIQLLCDVAPQSGQGEHLLAGLNCRTNLHDKTMMQRPMKFTKPITDFLFAQEGVTQEYPLLKHLEKEAPDFFAELGASPSLYQKHFLLFYRLYQLAESLKEKNLTLQISPLEIRLYSDVSSGSAALSETDALKAFYTDYDNLFLSETEVLAMQKQFWEKYLALDKKAEALIFLEMDLNEDVTLTAVKKQYKRLAQQHHPDKGGDAHYFKQLRDAYEQLKVLLS